MNESNEGIAARKTAAPRPWILGLAVLIATWAVYVNSLDGPFMWDDHQLIESSSRIAYAGDLVADVIRALDAA